MRNDADNKVRDDQDDLLDEGIQTALRFLSQWAEFFPFAVGLSAENKLVHIEFGSEDEQPPSNDVIEGLQEGIGEAIKEGVYSAVAIVYDTKVADDETEEVFDAICVDIEHCEADPIRCYLPYRFSDAKGQIETGEVIATAMEPVFFNTRPKGDVGAKGE